MQNTRPSLFGLIALGAALAMPVAFAQDEPTEAAPPESATQTQSTEQATQTQPATQAAPEASGPLTWADVDADKDGAISREESTRLASLAQVFDDADADKDGRLTVEEYKAYAAKADSSKAGSGGSD